MCRLLLLHNPDKVDPNGYLNQFRRLSKESKEYQGHGWGCSWLDDQGRWQKYHDIRPIWEDNKSNFPSTNAFLAHARSAFRDEGIVVENNMPFGDENGVFVFNGELQGVKVKAEGRIGAEKIANYILRFNQGNLSQAVEKGVRIIDHKTRYIRAMNFFLSSSQTIEVCTIYNEDPEYFQLRETAHEGTMIISSAELRETPSVWQRIENRTLRTILI